MIWRDGIPKKEYAFANKRNDISHQNFLNKQKAINSMCAYIHTFSGLAADWTRKSFVTLSSVFAARASKKARPCSARTIIFCVQKCKSCHQSFSSLSSYLEYPDRWHNAVQGKNTGQNCFIVKAGLCQQLFFTWSIRCQKNTPDHQMIAEKPKPAMTSFFFFRWQMHIFYRYSI